jgi:nicotinamide/nicotinate riboside kinase
LQDWDDPPTCILWPEFRDMLRHVRSTGVLPELHQSHDHLNKQVEVEIDSGVFERARARFTEIEADSHARGEAIVWYIVDGFVLFWDKVSWRQRIGLTNKAIVDMLDIRIFLRVPHDILKQRRDERQVYVLQSESP